MGDGSGDLQRVWHEFAAGLWSGATILDLGAGLGRSKDRLSVNGNVVTTQDIERSRMACVDLICQPEWLFDPVPGLDLPYRQKWDVVTAFDVIEHAACPREFLRMAWFLAKRELFFTTPNAIHSPAPWHFTLDDLREMVRIGYGRHQQVYGRFKNAEGERIEVLAPGGEAHAIAFGFLLRHT